MVTFLSVVGARPNFMKVAPVHRALQRYAGDIRHVILHTGQHYDENMSKVFFTDLELPQPDIYLGIGSGSHAEQTGKIMIEFEKVLQDLRPDLVIVYGDVNSTLACSVAASKLLIPVCHVEAGLRSFDRTMPEEINRMVTDVLSKYLFVTEEAGLINLRHEGIPDEKVFLVGDVMIDSLASYREKAAGSRIKEQFGVAPQGYTLVTLHRPSNVDSEENLRSIMQIFAGILEHTPIIFPVHPRTRNRLESFGLSGDMSSMNNLILCEPLGYLDFLNLMMDARLVLTDSGGIQEETTYLQVPCLTLRANTERPVTIKVGTNLLLGMDVERVLQAARQTFAGNPKQGRVPDMWDGRAAERIARILAEKHGVASVA